MFFLIMPFGRCSKNVSCVRPPAAPDLCVVTRGEEERGIMVPAFTIIKVDGWMDRSRGVGGREGDSFLSLFLPTMGSSYVIYSACGKGGEMLYP